MIAPDTELPQILTIITILGTAYMLTRTAINTKAPFGWWLPLGALLFHSLIFYTMLFGERLSIISPDVRFTVWSAWLRFHAYATIFGYSIVVWFIRRGNVRS